MLTAEGHKYVLSECCPPDPAQIENATEIQIKDYKDWIKADEMARCYILASMSNVLQHQHQSMETAFDMMTNLTEMFGHQNRAARQVAMREVLNIKMAEGTPVRDHVLKMIGLLNELEILGAQIDGETQVDIVLNSLAKRFKHFRLNYNMHKMSYSLTELLKELVSAEGLEENKSEVVLVTEKGSTSKSKGKKKQKKVQK